MLSFFRYDEHIQYSVFSSGNGNDEYFITAGSGNKSSFEVELSHLYQSLISLFINTGLNPNNLIFLRFYIKDINSHKSILQNSSFNSLFAECVVSVIQQPPLFNGEINLFAYCIKNNNLHKIKQTCSNSFYNSISAKGNNYNLLFTANLYDVTKKTVYHQTLEIFQNYIQILSGNKFTLLDNTIRTWIYVDDIDNNYSAMTEARKKIFSEQGLTPETRYIASTGINGKAVEKKSFVMMDALSISGLAKEQIISMEASGYLCPAINYGITFERGTRVCYGDRSHLFISGTASIDNKGNTIHIGNTEKQTLQTLENIGALLRRQGADFNNVAYFIAYLRNSADKNIVKQILSGLTENEVPTIFVEGAVCRPDWLVEIECIASTEDKNGFPEFF